MEFTTCPYPGLRPFNDDESIFFKGRERNIETIVELFEKKKFMMLTGASGDGKSSLIYAGVVPFARAGLFKAKYNSWAIADFRPERNPLGNFTTALNKYFKNFDAETLRKELGYGFSSLIDIYKKSDLYLDTERENWKNADEKERKLIKRKAANLLIIADQFEEFFTNAENYHNGVASVESQTVVNLLLETSKIALAQDIPIYVICTMRSDYIGQCAAFRGLPEYIGFSQFFVPRLKRNEISQVIEEPAMLNGNKISRRLSERLLNDITEGYDQLPILQHALNQIWKAADNGRVEMDLLQYAMVGGLPADQLPAEDKQKFNEWFGQLPEFKKKLFENPSLENILNAHANELFETAHQVSQANQTVTLSESETKLILRKTFQCLTKIDEARAVRNRMTLLEISQIIHHPKIKSEQIANVIERFREQGNTFLRPFISDDPQTRKTGRDTVLDITHESLIRNWDLLNDWAKEENENWLNWQDFNKQLQRWVNNNKARGFLLPIGPLTFFESWFNQTTPNKFWLARYDESEISQLEKLQKAEETLTHAQEFLRKSAAKLFFSRTVLKYGVNRILVAVSLLILAIVCTYYFFDFRKKQNSYVIEEISVAGFSKLKSPLIEPQTKAEFLVYNEIIHPGSLFKHLNELGNDTSAFDLAAQVFARTENMEEHSGRNEPLDSLSMPLLKYLDSLSFLISQNKDYSSVNWSISLSRLNKYLNFLAYVKSHLTATEARRVDALIEKNSERLMSTIYEVFLYDPSKVNIKDVNNGIFLLIALRQDSNFDDLVKKISPFEGKGYSLEKFNKFYPLTKNLNIGANSGLTHNGGYHVLACLYAADTEMREDSAFRKISLCLDSLLKNNPNYAYTQYYDFFEVINTMRTYGKFGKPGAVEFLDRATYYAGTSKMDFLEHLITGTYAKRIGRKKAIKEEFNNYVYVSHFSGPVARESAWSYYENELREMLLQKKMTWQSRVGNNEGVFESSNNSVPVTEMGINYTLAMLNKKKGCFYDEVYNDKDKAYACFDKAFEYYKRLPVDFYNTPMKMEFGLNNDFLEKPKNVFFYPKLVNETVEKDGNSHHWNPYGFMQNQSQSLSFYRYICEKINPKTYYADKDGLENLQLFYSVVSSISDSLSRKCITQIRQIVTLDPGLKRYINPHFLSFYDVKNAFDENDTAAAFEILKNMNLKEVKTSGFVSSSGNWQSGWEHKRLAKSIAVYLARCGDVDRSFELINLFEKPHEKRNLLIDIADKLQNDSFAVENSFIYLDSIFKNNDLDIKPRFGSRLIYVLLKVGTNDVHGVAKILLKDISEKRKQRAIALMIKGICYNGNYFRAKENFPEYFSSESEQELNNLILQAEAFKILREKKSGKRMPDYFLEDYERAEGDYETELN